MYTFKCLRKFQYFRPIQERNRKQLKTVTFSDLFSADWLSLRQRANRLRVCYSCVLNAVFEFWSISSNVLWVLDVFSKPFGFQQISQASVKVSVNVLGNYFIDVDLDYVTVEKALSVKQTFNKIVKLVCCFCE